jgi:hypothetical protein
MHSLNPFHEEDLDVILSAYEELGLRVLLAPQIADVGRVKARVFYSELLSADEQKRLSAPARQFPEGSVPGAAAVRSLPSRSDLRAPMPVCPRSGNASWICRRERNCRSTRTYTRTRV